MTLFNLATRNVRRNFTSYLLYIISLIVSIIIFYTFVSLRYEPTIVNLVQESFAANIVLTGGALVLIIFVTAFVIYSSNFFAHKRKNEIGLYLLLGLRKGQVGRMMFLEGLLMGVIALVVGIAVGILLSRLFVEILLAFVGMDVETTLSFSSSTIMITAISFVILICITSFSGYRIVYRFSLLELFKASEKTEKAPQSNLFLSMVGLLFLVLSYLLVTLQTTPNVPWSDVPVPLFMIVIIVFMGVGTYLFIRSVLPTGLNYLKNKKSFYFNGTNMISLSHLRFRLSTQIKILTMIVVLITSTVIVVGFTGSLYSNIKSETESFTPVSYQVIDSTEETERIVEQLITEKVGNDAIRFQKKVEIVRAEVAADSSIHLPEGYSSKFSLISVTDFNDLVKSLDKIEEFITRLNPDQVIPVLESAEGLSEGEINQLSGQTFSLQFGSSTLAVMTDQAKTYMPMRSTEGMLLVVNDTTFDRIKGEVSPSFTNLYQLDTDMPDLADAFMKLQNQFGDARFISYLSFYNDQMVVTGLFLFVGLFLGLAFIAATGSIIYFKQVTEAYNDRNQYILMKKIGMDDAQITTTISRQILVIFGVPLLLGISHASVVLVSFFSKSGSISPWPVLFTLGSFVIIYTIYYFLTVRAYSKIVMY